MKIYYLLIFLLLASLVFNSCSQDEENIPVNPSAQKEFSWCGYNWVKRNNSLQEEPGPNYFSSNDRNIRIENGNLHLTITNGGDGKWYSSEVYTKDNNFSYGDYTFYIEGIYSDGKRIENSQNLDENFVLGLFTWNNTQDAYIKQVNDEIDIEIAKWQFKNSTSILQYAVQPSNSGNWYDPKLNMGELIERIKKNEINLGERNIVSFRWEPDLVTFYKVNEDGTKNVIWTYGNNNEPFRNTIRNGIVSDSILVPQALDGTQVVMNLWLFDQLKGNDAKKYPALGKEIEVVISKFEYKPIVNNTLNIGLIAYYPFNNNSNDESGNRNNGTVNGTKLTNDRNGNYNNAMEFNGTNSYISVNNSTLINNIENNSNISISSWVKISDWTGEESKKDYFPIISKNSGRIDLDGRKYDGWELLLQRDNMIFLFNRDDTLGSQLIQSGYKFDLNQWYFVCMTYQKGGNITFYIDGNEIFSAKEDRELEKTFENPLYIGYSPLGLVEYSDGIIDEIRIYNRCLSNKEVSELFYKD